MPPAKLSNTSRHHKTVAEGGPSRRQQLKYPLDDGAPGNGASSPESTRGLNIAWSQKPGQHVCSEFLVEALPGNKEGSEGTTTFENASICMEGAACPRIAFYGCPQLDPNLTGSSKAEWSQQGTEALAKT